ncbi:TLC domain-containing protein [Mucidula mucida]|nr:TLC domain-containing protein [Mucidula mucida]
MNLELAIEAAGLTRLTPHLPALLYSAAFFTFIHLVIAPVVSLWLFPETYGKMSRRARNNWCIHVVSQAHVVVIIPLAVRALNLQELEDDKAFGWNEQVGLLTAVASGYFLWDTLDAIINFIDLGFVLHGLACLAIYVGSFKPFLAYYAARCLLWETSTFFLNIHWFLDKTNRTGSTFQLINGLCLLVAFFVMRLVYGGLYVSTSFVYTLYDVRDQIPLLYIGIYLGGNIVLNTLNVLWFGKMIKSISSRFSGEQATKKPVSKGVSANGNGKITNGKAH